MERPIIYKYPLVEGITDLVLPIGTRILTTQIQFNTPTIWAMVDLNKTAQAHYQILCVGTGFELPQDFEQEWKYIDTIQDEYYVWHIFYKIKKIKEN